MASGILKAKDLSPELRKQLGISGGRSKYNVGDKSTRTAGGITFASTAEAKRYGQLMLMEKAGKIRALELQPKFTIEINGKKVGKYIADFAYEMAGKVVVEDVKGVRTELYRFKKKCVEAQYPVVIREISVK